MPFWGSKLIGDRLIKVGSCQWAVRIFAVQALLFSLKARATLGLHKRGSRVRTWIELSRCRNSLGRWIRFPNWMNLRIMVQVSAKPRIPWTSRFLWHGLVDRYGMVLNKRSNLRLLQQVGRVSTKYKKSKSGAASAMASTLSFEQRHGVDGTFFSFEILSSYMSKQLSKTSFGSCISILADKLENLPPKNTSVWLISIWHRGPKQMYGSSDHRNLSPPKFRLKGQFGCFQTNGNVIGVLATEALRGISNVSSIICWKLRTSYRITLVFVRPFMRCTHNQCDLAMFPASFPPARRPTSMYTKPRDGSFQFLPMDLVRKFTRRMTFIAMRNVRSKKLMLKWLSNRFFTIMQRTWYKHDAHQSKSRSCTFEFKRQRQKRSPSAAPRGASLLGWCFRSASVQRHPLGQGRAEYVKTKDRAARHTVNKNAARNISKWQQKS